MNRLASTRLHCLLAFTTICHCEPQRIFNDLIPQSVWTHVGGVHQSHHDGQSGHLTADQRQHSPSVQLPVNFHPPLALSFLRNHPFYTHIIPIYVPLYIPVGRPSGPPAAVPFGVEQEENRIVGSSGLRATSCTFFDYSGSCYRGEECQTRGGRPTNYCQDFTKFCCIVHKSCGESSDEQVSYFRNLHYPLAGVVPTSCTYTLRKAPGSCAVRVTARKLTLPANTGYCDGIYFTLKGGEANVGHQCGELTGKTFSVPFGSVDVVALELASSPRIQTSFEIQVTQTPCSSGGFVPGDVPIVAPVIAVTPARPVWPETTKPSHALPLPTFPDLNHDFECGVSIKSSGRNAVLEQNLRDRFQRDLTLDDEPESELEPEGKRVSNKRKHLSSNPLLTSLEWAVPDLKQTDFYKALGHFRPVQDRITFGQPTERYEFPWQVAMYANGRFHCGASVIGDRYILTAAHCVHAYTRRPSYLKLTIGDWNVKTQQDGVNIEGQLEDIRIHPGYSTATLRNDIAVLKLTSPLQYSKAVRPVCLPSSDIPADGRLLTVTGWGRNEQNVLQTILQKHSAFVVPINECRARWEESSSRRDLITDMMICMDAGDGDSCKGDSGGPTVLEHPQGSGKYVQMGVVSFGSASCTNQRLPGVYTDVRDYVSWIRQQMY